VTTTELITTVVACAVAVAVGWLLPAAVALLFRRREVVRSAALRGRPPLIATLGTATFLASMPGELTSNTWSGVRHLVDILLIGSVTWLLVAAVRISEDVAARRLRIDVEDNLRVRRLRTQISIVRRIVIAVLVVVGAAVALMTFDRMRTLGASLLASAGIAGVVGGLAAQSTLVSVFAGLQLAFTDKLRIDDVVVVEDEWGRVEEITLTYVVVHLWDERRLVLPTTYFTSQPFQNWTRTSARVLGSVEIYADFDTPVDEMRAEAERIVHASPLWDGQVWTLQVTDSTENAMLVRILASAADASRSFDLRCEIREKLIDWMVRRQPRAVPRVRLVPPLPAGGRVTA
jgi:small-conductance mechanosensitive channel